MMRSQVIMLVAFFLSGVAVDLGFTGGFSGDIMSTIGLVSCCLLSVLIGLEARDVYFHEVIVDQWTNENKE